MVIVLVLRLWGLGVLVALAGVLAIVRFVSLCMSAFQNLARPFLCCTEKSIKA